MIKLPQCKTCEDVVDNPNLVKIGDFLINIIEVSIKEIKHLRKYLPKLAYKMVKNRKQAREHRNHKKLIAKDAK